MFRARFTLVVLLVTAVAAACGQSTTATHATSPASSAPSVAPSAVPSSPPSVAPSTPASAAPSAAGSAGPVASGDLSATEDLRAFLPGAVGGHTLVKTLFTGPEFEAFPASVSEQMRALLKGLGREPRDLTMAVASDPLAEIDVTITAFRVRDVQADVFFEAYVPLVKDSFPAATINETVLGSKTVFDVSLDGQSVGTTFLYPRDDVLFIVTGTDLDLVDEAFLALP